MASSSMMMNSMSSLASNQLQISSSDMPLRSRGRTTTMTTMFGGGGVWRRGMSSRSRSRSSSIVVNMRKVKKHDYPWPDDPDPNIKGGILRHLSHFKPLKENEKPKPVVLDFEKPLMDLQKKITDVKKLADKTELDFTDQIEMLEEKYEQALRELYMHLTPIQRVQIARHPNRPTFLDHVFNITETFVELHGDRAGYDDPAIVGGIGSIEGDTYMFIGHQKGRNTKENIKRNFGMPTPHGYRKALRLMRYADHHDFPIITFIDTPGAYADLKSEELGQGEAIAHNLREMFGLKVPIISIVIGEGGSGGALAIGCGNKLLMLENAVFYVASPEACAAILWKSAKAAPMAAEKLKITAAELCKLDIADGIIPEPLGGAHADPAWTSQQIKDSILEAMEELDDMETEELLEHRAHKFRKLGGYQEGIPIIRPENELNMQKREVNVTKTSIQELESDIEKLKQQLRDREIPRKASIQSVRNLIKKLRREVDMELAEAVVALGFKGRFMAIKEEVSKADTSEDQVIPSALLDKVNKFQDDWSQRLPTAPNYATLVKKIDMLENLVKLKDVSVKKLKAAPLKQKVEKKLEEFMGRADLKERVEALKAEILESGASSFKDLDQDLADRVLEVKKEMESGVADALKSLNLDVKIVKAREKSILMGKIGKVNKEIKERIDEAAMSPDLKKKIDSLRLLLAKAGKTPDQKLRSQIQDLQQQVREKLFEALTSSELPKKFDELKMEISQSTLFSEDTGVDESVDESVDGSVDGTLDASVDGSVDGGLNNSPARLEVNLGS